MFYAFTAREGVTLGLGGAVMLASLRDRLAMRVAERGGKLRSDADGRTWLRLTPGGLSRAYPWWSPDEALEVLRGLVRDGHVLRHVLPDAEDGGAWYALPEVAAVNVRRHRKLVEKRPGVPRDTPQAPLSDFDPPLT